MRTALTLLAPLMVACGAAACLAQEGLTPAAPTARGFDHAHTAWTTVLRERVRGDRFDYAKLAKQRAPLDAYLVELATVTPEEFGRWEREQRFAFWINAYNAWTVRTVVDGWPVKSIKDLGDEQVGVWKRERLPLGHLAPELEKPLLSLDDVEHRILRPVYKDARLHAAVNCASVGCPPLRAEAFVAERLVEQLDQQTTAWLSDTARNRFDRQRGLLEVSQVFEWFPEDFVREAGSVQAWIARFLPAEREWLDTKKRYEIRYLPYSWELNVPAE